MTDEDGQLPEMYRTLTDKRGHLVRMYQTIWWLKTRDLITMRFVDRSDRLLGLIEGVSECDEILRRDIEAEVERIRNDAMSPPRGKMTAKHEAIWDAAMDFFLDPVKLTDSIINDKAVRGLRAGVTQKQGLGTNLHSYLNARRRETDGMTEHEHRVWVKLNRISNDVMLEYPHGRLRPLGYRCSWEHAENVRKRILKEMPKDGLVGNMRASTIKQYFDLFSDEGRKLAAEEYERLRLRTPGEGATGLPPQLRDAALQRLEAAIEQLDEPLRGVIRASLQPDKGAEYRCRQGMEDGEFERLRRLAIRELRGRLDPEEEG